MAVCTEPALRRLTPPAPRARRSRYSHPNPHPSAHPNAQPNPRPTSPPPQHRARAPLWLFDLDNTLHDTSHAIFPRINQAMTRAVREALGCDEAAANALRARYWQRYGATVIGMVRHHNVDAHQFLRRSHDFDVAQLVRAERGLAAHLKRLPGRKVLVTNAPLHYARAVLRHLRILHLFDGLWGLEQMRIHGPPGHFRPKPSAALLRHLLAVEGATAARTVLVEDTLANLKSARRVGLRTVHVFHPGTPGASTSKGRPAYVNLRVTRVADLLLRRRVVRGGS